MAPEGRALFAADFFSVRIVRGRARPVRCNFYISALLPVAGDWLKSNPVEFVTVLAAVNVIVRFVSHGKVEIFSDKSGSGMLPIVVMIVTAVGLGSALPSCTALEAVDVDGKVYYLHESGAKGGIDLVPGGKPRVWWRVGLGGDGVDGGGK